MCIANCHLCAFYTLLDITPKEADFLYVYATTKSYGASRHPIAGSLFVQTLIEVMEQTLGCYHLEEILLFLKSEMAEKRMEVRVKDDNNKDKVAAVKQIVSVVSQLRGRLYFAKD